MKPPTAPQKLYACLLVICAILAGSGQGRAALTNGLVAYWPFDNVAGCNNQTPDVIHGYNLEPVWGIAFASGLFHTNFNSSIYLTNDAVRGKAIL